MTTLLHLGQSIADMQEHLAREQHFSHDACQNLLTGVKLCREAIDALERDIRNHFNERDRSVARLIGNSQSYKSIINGSSHIAPAIGAVGADYAMGMSFEGVVGPAGPIASVNVSFQEEEKKNENSSVD